MDKKQLILILSIFVIIIASSAVVSAGLFDSNDDKADIKTHEFNYSNKATFNLSDELTEKTGVESILFGEGVSYEYPPKDGSDDGLVNMLGGLASYGGSDTVESKQNTAYYEEIESELSKYRKRKAIEEISKKIAPVTTRNKKTKLYKASTSYLQNYISSRK